MAKFCANCGAQANDAAQVCGNCGAPFEGFVAPQEAAAKKQFDVNALIKDPKVKKFAPIVAIVLVVVIVLVALISSGGGAESAVKKYMKGIEKADGAKIMEVMSAEELEYINDMADLADEDNEKFAVDQLTEYADEVLDDFEDIVGKDLKMSYKVVGVYDLTEEMMEDLVEDYEDSKINTDKLDAKNVAVEITIKGSKDKYTFIRQLQVVKEDGDWKIANGIY